MFKTMYASIHDEVASLMFKLEPPPEAEVTRQRSVFSGIAQKAIHQEVGPMPRAVPAPGMSLPTEEHGAIVPPVMPQTFIPRSGDKVGRNDVCPCGSGKKYKKCCGQ